MKTTKDVTIRETEDGRIFINSITGWVSDDYQKPSITTRRISDGRLLVDVSYIDKNGNRKSEDTMWQYAEWLPGDEKRCAISIADVQYTIGFWFNQKTKTVEEGKPKWLAIRRHDGKVIAPSGDIIQFKGAGATEEYADENEGAI